MPGALKETYVGPGARWAMLLVDYPEATHRETLVGVAESDIPAEYRKQRRIPDGERGRLVDVEKVALCVIDFGPGSSRDPVVAYRFPDDWEKGRSGWYCPTDETPTGWETFSSKALHRALKEAGYPADTKEIQLLLLYRRRVAENEAIRRGVLPAPLASMPADEERQVIEGAGVEDSTGDLPDTRTHEPHASIHRPIHPAGTVSNETMARLSALPEDLLEQLETFLGERDLTLAALDHNRTAQAFLTSLENRAVKAQQPDGEDDPGRPFELDSPAPTPA